MITYKDSTDRSSDLPIQSSSRYYAISSNEIGWDNHFSETALKVVDKTILINAYEYLKTLPEFSGAVDI